MRKAMKLKHRLMFAVCLLFIFFVSFKILQPVIQEDTLDSEPSTIDVLVAEFLSHYDYEWDTELTPQEAWSMAARGVNNRSIHPDYAPALGGVLKMMSEARITHAGVGIGGTQLKLTLTLEGGQAVVFKPKWYARDFIVHGKPYDGRDRHNAEVLGFHLNRLLGYNRAPLAVGRKVDLLTDIVPVADKTLLKTFFNKGDKTCFYGKCLYCKSERDGVCGEGSQLEGALILWLPPQFGFLKWKHPWRRTYRDDKHMRWEVEDTFCDVVKKTDPYNSGPRLMDIMDAVVLDYLIGNADRHHYETFNTSSHSILIMLDNAKSLGNPYEDEASILAPLRQCCRIRKSTYERLKALQHGVLTKVLQKILSKDPISPVVSEPHYTAIDRRLSHILLTIDTCFHKSSIDDVLTNS